MPSLLSRHIDAETTSVCLYVGFCHLLISRIVDAAIFVWRCGGEMLTLHKNIETSKS